MKRFKIFQDFRDLENAIMHIGSVAYSTPVNDTRRPSRLLKLVSFYELRWLRFDLQDDVEKMVQISSEALSVTYDGHEMRPWKMSYMGQSLRL